MPSAEDEAAGGHRIEHDGLQRVDAAGEIRLAIKQDLPILRRFDVLGVAGERVLLTELLDDTPLPSDDGAR